MFFIWVVLAITTQYFYLAVGLTLCERYIPVFALVDTHISRLEDETTILSIVFSSSLYNLFDVVLLCSNFSTLHYCQTSIVDIIIAPCDISNSFAKYIRSSYQGMSCHHHHIIIIHFTTNTLACPTPPLQLLLGQATFFLCAHYNLQFHACWPPTTV